MSAQLQYPSPLLGHPNCITFSPNSTAHYVTHFNEIASEDYNPEALHIIGSLNRDAECWKALDGFDLFIQLYTSTFTTLTLQSMRFQCFTDVIDLVNCFSSVEHLVILDCHWHDPAVERWKGCGCHKDEEVDCHCDGPSVLDHLTDLQTVCVRMDSRLVTCAYSLARWLVHGRCNGRLPFIEWMFCCPLSNRDATFSISETLHILGSSLASVILEPSYSSPDHEPAQVEGPAKLELPDLSHNKQLRWVRLLNVAKDDCPEGYVSDVVSMIYPKHLEHLQIEFRSSTCNAGPWQDIGFIQLANLLASQHRASWKSGVYLYVGVDPGQKHADAVAQLAALEATIKSRHADSLGQYLLWTPMVTRKSVY